MADANWGPLKGEMLEKAVADDVARRSAEAPAVAPPPARMGARGRLPDPRRDALAAAAAQGLLGASGLALSDAQVRQMAALSVRLADALIEELDRP